MKMSNIKNIIFDVGNVLMEWNPKHISELMFENEKEQGIAYKYVFNNEDWYQGDTGFYTLEEFILLLSKNVPQEYKYIVKEALEKFPFVIPINEAENAWGIKMAMKGYNIYILSNFNQTFPKALERLPIKKYLKGYVYSSKYKLTKPSEDVFKLLLDNYNLVPEECLFIDDSLTNCIAAKRLGINVINYLGDIKQLVIPN